MLFRSGAHGGRTYHTGHIRVQHGDGTDTLLGRRDTQVKGRGVRVERGEVEALVEDLQRRRGCRVDLTQLDRRIDERVEAMVERGLVDEVRGLLDRGISAAAPGMSATGYAEFVPVASGLRSCEEAVADRKSTRLNSSHMSESRMPSSA